MTNILIEKIPNQPFEITVVESPPIQIDPVGMRGPAGPPGESTGLIIRPSATALSGGRVVAINAIGQLIYADQSNIGLVGAIMGVLRNAIAIAADGTVITAGIVIDPTWTWTPQQPLFLDGLGFLSHAPPLQGILQQVAIALSSIEILVDLKSPILR